MFILVIFQLKRNEKRIQLRRERLIGMPVYTESQTITLLHKLGLIKDLCTVHLLNEDNFN